MKDKNNYVPVVALICVAAVAAVWIISNALSGGMTGETVTVEGVSEVSVLPDLVSVVLSVQTLNDTAEAAKNENARIVSEVKDALISAGFSRDDFETQNFNVYEEYDWSKDQRTSIGFRATHTIVVKVDSEDETMIGKAIDAAVDNGAMLSYVNFELSQELENEYKAKALKLAAEDARTKGEAVAEGLGGRLGDVVSTQMSDSGRYYPMLAYAEDSAAGSVKGTEVATNIQVSEQKIQSQITVTYELK